MELFNTGQESFWAGDFGDQYIQRNDDKDFIEKNRHLFNKIFNRIKVDSVIEFGANIGLNLLAIRQLKPHVELSAVEINNKAIAALRNIEGIKIYAQSILNFKPDYTRDFVFTKGLLIHINPDWLHKVYELLYSTSSKYISIIEYYNPKPVMITYRGHQNRLFKRDFAGEILDRYPNLRLIDYGFVYHRDPDFPQDDINWFLLEKT